jgi:predicted amidohydrolase YtcJ
MSERNIHLPKTQQLRFARLLVLLWLCLIGIALGQTKHAEPADILIINARVYTVNAKQPWAEAVAIRGEKIEAVGTAQELAHLRGASTKVIDAGGRLVLPGFTDSHIHFVEGSLNLLHVHLDDAKNIAEVQKRVKEFADKHPEASWILGRGWSYPIFGAAAVPDKKYLDEVVPDRPVYLTAFDGHSFWANSKALQLAGITAKTPDPPNGYFVRDPATGEPTGAIKEDGADALMDPAIPLPNRVERLAALRAGMIEANKAGLVRGICTGNLGQSVANDDFANADLYEELRKSGELSVRIYYAFAVDPPAVTTTVLSQIEQARKRDHDEWISAGAIKFYLDGVIESHTAAMLTPYSDDPKQIGALFWAPANYKKAVAQLDHDGFQIFTHAIGDKAVRLALDAYEEAALANHTHDARPRIEHIETVSAEDIPRFGKLGVIASFQPLHAYPDDDTLNVWLRNAGEERGQRAWAWHSIETAGGHLAFGSDWPVVTLNPWQGVQNALTRQTTEGNPPGGFVPHERVSLEDAVKGYTLGAAYSGRREKTEGSLEPGKLADLIVVSQDLFKIEPAEIGKTEVLLTMVGGKVVYQAPNWNADSTSKGTK